MRIPSGRIACLSELTSKEALDETEKEHLIEYLGLQPGPSDKRRSMIKKRGATKGHTASSGQSLRSSLNAKLGLKGGVPLEAMPLEQVAVY